MYHEIFFILGISLREFGVEDDVGNLNARHELMNFSKLVRLSHRDRSIKKKKDAKYKSRRQIQGLIVERCRLVVAGNSP